MFIFNTSLHLHAEDCGIAALPIALALYTAKNTSATSPAQASAQ